MTTASVRALFALLLAFPLATLFFIALIAGPYTPDVLLTLAFAIVPLTLLAAAAMLGLALTAPFKKLPALSLSPWPDAYRLLLSLALGLGTFSLAGDRPA